MKGKYALQILKVIGEAVVNATDMARVVVEHPNRAALLTESGKNLASIQLQRENAEKVRKEYFRRADRYQNLIAWLKRDGIIKEIIVKKKKCFYLTAKGKRYREMLLERQKNELPKPQYEKRKEKKTVIVAFDIPEKENRKRAWLRQALTNIGFRMIQKSVWIGRTQIPPEMIRDLYHLNLLESIEIFSVTQKGSLRNLKHHGSQRKQ